MDSLLLTIIVFFPLLGVVLVSAMRADDDAGKNRVRFVTMATFVVGFLVSLRLWFQFDRDQAAMQMVERRPWIAGFGIEYYLGVDGLSVLLVMLTTFLAPLVMLGSWNAVQDKVKGFCVCLMLLQTGMLGAFVALDLFLFYVFWELMLIPLYFIIGIWGGKRRVYAAIKLFVYTLVGSLLMLIAVLYLAWTYGTFDVLRLYEASIPVTAQLWLFGFFALAFAIKVPMFPFHTWLPDAHVEAPTAGSVILAGVLLKMGTYGFVRFAMPLFPEALVAYGPLLAVLALIGIVYGALVAMVQPDVKKLVAYSSVSHLGYVILGLVALNPQGIQGGILQMVNHGLSTGALFLLVGMIYERRHTRMIKDFGGIAKVMPVYAFFFMMITFSSIGLPGLNGFVGEMLILLGVFRYNVYFATIAALGVILGAAYMLWMFRRVFFGPITHEENRSLKDLSGRETVILSAILVFVVWIGVYPSTFLTMTDESVALLIERSTSERAASGAASGPAIRITGLRPVGEAGRGPTVPLRRLGDDGVGRPEVRRVLPPSGTPGEGGAVRPEVHRVIRLEGAGVEQGAPQPRRITPPRQIVTDEARAAPPIRVPRPPAGAAEPDRGGEGRAP